MNEFDSKVEILKLLWKRQEDGRWGIDGMKGLTLKAQSGFDADFFKFESEVALLTSTPDTRSLFTSFGTTDFLMKQSILPVVAWVEGESFIRCIGTAFVISCTGYVMTACHVLLDPQDKSYGSVTREGNISKFMDGLKMGVLVPLNVASGRRGYIFFAFEQSWYWGEWGSSPLIHERDRFNMLTDVAICKIPEMSGGAAHQPLALSLNAFAKGEKAYALGYANMNDIPIEIKNGKPVIEDFEHDLYVSIGEAMDVFPENHLRKDVPTPGPCFDFKAKVPGKMSGGPILGGDGAVVRGVVSRSFSGEKHAYGAMLGPAMHLPLMEGKTLKKMMESENEGIAKIRGVGL